MPKSVLIAVPEETIRVIKCPCGHEYVISFAEPVIVNKKGDVIP
jgi:hypothetical protein